MLVTILLKNGKKFEYSNADIQKKDNGRSTAVFDTSTFRVIAEFKAEQIATSQCSKANRIS